MPHTGFQRSAPHARAGLGWKPSFPAFRGFADAHRGPGSRKRFSGRDSAM